MPRRKSNQSKWMTNPRNVNWRGQRPKFNPEPIPICRAWSIEQLKVELKRQEIKVEDTIEHLNARIEARLKTLLKRGG
jgi:hypothetical protein